MVAVPSQDAAIFAGPDLDPRSIEIYACHACQQRTNGRLDSHLTQCFPCGSEDIEHLYTVPPSSPDYPFYVLGEWSGAA